MFDVDATVGELARDAAPGCLAHVEQIAARDGDPAGPGSIATDMRARLARLGIEELWSHQDAALRQVRAGRNVVVATGTASGKSLVYLLAAVDAVTEDPKATALLMFPTKALAHDQLRALRALAVPALRPAAYDGDTPRDDRAWARRTANVIVTNPDMVHAAMLPDHQRWSAFYASLRVVVIDELHTLRGVFGSHVAAVIRRLRRITARYGADPVFVASSATIGNPARHASALTGLPFAEVTEDGSPAGRKTFVLWDPPKAEVPGSEPDEDAPRLSAGSQSASLLATLASDGIRTIAFARSRMGAEMIAEEARRETRNRPGVEAPRIASYRAGYLPEERRELEARLSDGTLTAIAATSALELGIDIGGLDACIITGFPGSIASLRQQAGRAGRRGAQALAIMVANDDPLDRFLLAHPERLFRGAPEDAVCDPHNPYVQAAHLICAASELPLTEDDVAIFGEGSATVRDRLTAEGALRKRGVRWHTAPGGSPSADVDLRAAGRSVQIADVATGALLGTSDEARAPASLHPGAIYLHQGERYLVESLDLEGGVALVGRTDAPYHTQARSITELQIVSTRDRSSGPAAAFFGEVELTNQVVSYSRRRMYTGESLGEEALDLPPRMLRTAAVWWEVPPETLQRAFIDPGSVPGSAHAAEHAAISLMPLIATCDRWDIGGVSYALHPQTGVCTIFIYDGYPGGAGFAERCFERSPEHLEATRDAIRACACSKGCPGCVISPKCGNGNEPLDKAGAVRLLSALLAG